MSADTGQRQFTGWHMLIVMLCFYAAIITANLTMAITANRTWSGLVVANSYVASQQFNSKAAEGREQAALGWESKLDVQGSKLRYSLTDPAGAPIDVQKVTATVRRPASSAEDQTLTLSPGGNGQFEANAELHDGVWIVETDADVGAGKPYRYVSRIIIRQGALQ